MHLVLIGGDVTTTITSGNLQSLCHCDCRGTDKNCGCGFGYTVKQYFRIDKKKKKYFDLGISLDSLSRVIVNLLLILGLWPGQISYKSFTLLPS